MPNVSNATVDMLVEQKRSLKIQLLSLNKRIDKEQERLDELRVRKTEIQAKIATLNADIIPD